MPLFGDVVAVLATIPHWPPVVAHVRPPDGAGSRVVASQASLAPIALVAVAAVVVLLLLLTMSRRRARASLDPKATVLAAQTAGPSATFVQAPTVPANAVRGPEGPAVQSGLQPAVQAEQSSSPVQVSPAATAVVGVGGVLQQSLPTAPPTPADAESLGANPEAFGGVVAREDRHSEEAVAVNGSSGYAWSLPDTWAPAADSNGHGPQQTVNGGTDMTDSERQRFFSQDHRDVAQQGPGPQAWGSTNSAPTSVPQSTYSAPVPLARQQAEGAQQDAAPVYSPPPEAIRQDAEAQPGMPARPQYAAPAAGGSSGSNPARQRLDEARGMAQQLDRALQGLAEQIAASESDNQQLYARMQALEQSTHGSESFRQSVAERMSAGVPMADVPVLQGLLQALIEKPNDLLVLVKLSEHAQKLSSIVDNYSALRGLVERE